MFSLIALSLFCLLGKWLFCLQSCLCVRVVDPSWHWGPEAVRWHRKGEPLMHLLQIRQKVSCLVVFVYCCLVGFQLVWWSLIIILSLLVTRDLCVLYDLVSVWKQLWHNYDSDCGDWAFVVRAIIGCRMFVVFLSSCLTYSLIWCQVKWISWIWSAAWGIVSVPVFLSALLHFYWYL